ncbi:MAG: TRAP transporter small permease [Rhodospirillales bacterium]|nr:TRAP transporter small permease [Rhodospirillales bacterium]
MNRALAAVRWLAFWFATACFAFMLIAVVVQVLGRYVAHFQIGNAVELAIFAQIWLAMIGAGLAMRRGTIFAIDSLAQLLPLGPARILSVAMVLASLGFLGVVIYGSFALIEIGYDITSPTMEVPMWIVYVPVPIGMAYFGIETVMRAADRWNDPFGQEAPAITQEEKS